MLKDNFFCFLLSFCSHLTSSIKKIFDDFVMILLSEPYFQSNLIIFRVNLHVKKLTLTIMPTSFSKIFRYFEKCTKVWRKIKCLGTLLFVRGLIYKINFYPV